MHVKGFSGRAATTTLHDASESGLSISGIFQAAEDFAVLCLYNAYDYFSHLHLKHLPRTDLSGLRLEFDIEYDHALDSAVRFDAAKYPSVSWDAITFVCGAGDLYEVRLLDHATAIASFPWLATCRVETYCRLRRDQTAVQIGPRPVAMEDAGDLHSCFLEARRSLLYCLHPHAQDFT